MAGRPSENHFAFFHFFFFGMVLVTVSYTLERCCLDPLEEPGSKRPPNTGARLWGRVRSKLLRQKVREGAGAGGQRGTEVGGGVVLGPWASPFGSSLRLLPARGTPATESTL